MLEPRPPRPSALPRLSVTPPSVTPPPPDAERRVAFRRAADQTAHEERTFLARALDVLAADAPAEERLAALLALLARTAGARRAAVLADGAERRAAVAVAPDEDPSAGEALAAWLDATAERSRAERAAARPASVSVVTTVAGIAPLASTARRSSAATSAGSATGAVTYARVAVPRSAGTRPRLRVRRRGPTPPGSRRACRPASPATRPWPWRSSPPSSPPNATRRCCGRATPSGDRFMSTVAHELRTPLTGLRGYLELILDGRVDDPDVEREFLLRSRAIVDSMGELVGDLLELSRLESGTLELEIGPFSAAEAAGAGRRRAAADRDRARHPPRRPTSRRGSGRRPATAAASSRC